MKIYILLLAAIVIPTSLLADVGDEIRSGGLTYTITKEYNNGVLGEVKVGFDGGYTATQMEGDISIPQRITSNKKTYQVTKIGDRAFYDQKSILSVTIP